MQIERELSYCYLDLKSEHDISQSKIHRETEIVYDENKDEQ